MTLHRLMNLVCMNSFILKSIYILLIFIYYFSFQIDKCMRTKLRLAYLQYPDFDIYRLSESTIKPCSRTLLIALSWLISKYDVLENVVRLKLIKSSLGREFSKFHINDVRFDKNYFI